MRAVIYILIGLALILGAYWVPINVPPWADFIMLYTATRGLRQGVGLYNPADQAAMMQTILPEGLALPLYVYPPWYALSTFFLGWFSPEQAARIWFLLNVAFLVVSVLLLTETWTMRKRVISIAFSFLFLPALGLIWVGQFVMPVLMGGALFLAGARRKSAWMTVVGLLLLTFKPHVGILMILVGGLWLLANREAWSRRAIWSTILGCFVLVGVSFLYDLRWPVNYLQALRGFGNLSTFVICDLCAGVSTSLARVLVGQPDTALALWISAAFFILMGIWLSIKRPSLMREGPLLFVLMATVVLFVNPYLMNYDFVLLLLPLAYLTNSGGRKSVLLPTMLFILPWAGFLLGTRSLLSAALAVCAVLIGVLVSRDLGVPRYSE